MYRHDVQLIYMQVIHATPELQTTLRNVHQLLTPQGRFFLQELRPCMYLFFGNRGLYIDALQ